MLLVQLVKRYAVRGGPAYNIGERVAFEDALAHTLIHTGIAVRAPEAPPVHRMIETAPIKKDLKRKGRTDAE